MKSVVNVDTIKQEIEEDKLGRDNIGEDEVNPYYRIITNKKEKENIITLQMEQWSIRSNTVNCVQYDRHPKNFYDLDIKIIDQKNHRKIYDRFKEEDRQILELDHGDFPEKLREDYLVIYDRIWSEVISTSRFDESSCLSTTYLGRVDTTKGSKIKAEKIPYIRSRVCSR